MAKIKTILSLLLALLMLGGCASSVQNQNDTDFQNKNDLTVAVTSVAICQILDRLGFENVVGIPETSSEIPEKYKTAATIGSPMNPDIEIIKSISPDLVLSPQTLEASLSQTYSNAGITSAFLDLSSVEGMYAAITSLGEYLGLEKEAELLNEEYYALLKKYDIKESDKEDILLLMAFPDGFYLVATENSYVGNLVKLAGGRNVYGSDYKGDENGFVSINPEDIVQKNPDRIFVFAHYSEENAFKYMQKEFSENIMWQSFDAVKNEKITYLPSSLFGMSANLGWTESLDYLRPILCGDSQ